MVSQSSRESLTLLIGGDVFINRPKPETTFAHVASAFRKADIVLVNQEGAISDRGSPLPGKIEAGSGGHLRTSPDNVKGLVEGGITAVGLANNHTMDFQEEGLLQTLEVLEKVGIPRAGAGKNLEEAHRPLIVERHGIKVALLSYTSVYVPVSFPADTAKPGVAVVGVSTAYEIPFNAPYSPGVPPRIITIPNPEHKARMIEDVRRAKAEADFVVVSCHWGVTPQSINKSTGLPVDLGPGYVTTYQEELGRAAIDAGADLIMGHHPHRLQGLEVYNGRLICYSLGNFAFDRPHTEQGRLSMMVKYEIKGKEIQRMSYLPVIINEERQPVVTSPQKAEAVTKVMETLSQPYNTAFRIEGDEVVIGPK